MCRNCGERGLLGVPPRAYGQPHGSPHRDRLPPAEDAGIGRLPRPAAHPARRRDVRRARGRAGRGGGAPDPHPAAAGRRPSGDDLRAGRRTRAGGGLRHRPAPRRRGCRPARRAAPGGPGGADPQDRRAGPADRPHRREPARPYDLARAMARPRAGSRLDVHPVPLSHRRGVAVRPPVDLRRAARRHPRLRGGPRAAVRAGPRRVADAHRVAVRALDRPDPGGAGAALSRADGLAADPGFMGNHCRTSLGIVGA
ncbi:hypothetical protein GA0074695_4387 [Micromonospora viridifaciens]|uniref:Uncharacterized protein n=1 Tax=Micromonospora viridifaciens TaxID=1881 RepID=A0A1C4YKH3_MICVI|nr:hypothetical protein GA0074695_4387 [Micromonospora viridifaciens]